MEFIGSSISDLFYRQLRGRYETQDEDVWLYKMDRYVIQVCEEYSSMYGENGISIWLEF